jgi:hypothetical protein
VYGVMRLRPRPGRRKRNAVCKKLMLSAEFKFSAANGPLPHHPRRLLHQIPDATGPMERMLEDIEREGGWQVKMIRIGISDSRPKMLS